MNNDAKQALKTGVEASAPTPFELERIRRDELAHASRVFAVDVGNSASNVAQAIEGGRFEAARASLKQLRERLAIAAELLEKHAPASATGAATPTK